MLLMWEALLVFTRVIVKYCRNVYSFEPSSIVYKQLKKTSKKFKNIKCQKLAISNFKGKVCYLDPKRLSENTISQKFLAKRKNFIKHFR